MGHSFFAICARRLFSALRYLVMMFFVYVSLNSGRVREQPSPESPEVWCLLRHLGALLNSYRLPYYRKAVSTVVSSGAHVGSEIRPSPGAALQCGSHRSEAQTSEHASATHRRRPRVRRLGVLHAHRSRRSVRKRGSICRALAPQSRAVTASFKRAHAVCAVSCRRLWSASMMKS